MKEAYTKLMKGLLELIVLTLLNTKPMHGYEIICKLRKTFGVYFGPSTIYPLLNKLEKSEYVTSVWNVDIGRPKKIYTLTPKGKDFLTLTEDSLNLILRKIGKTETLVVGEPAFQRIRS